MNIEIARELFNYLNINGYFLDYNEETFSLYYEDLYTNIKEIKILDDKKCIEFLLINSIDFNKELLKIRNFTKSDYSVISFI